MLFKAPKYFLVTLLVVGALILNGCSGEELGSTTNSSDSSVAESYSDTTAQATLASDIKNEAVPGMNDLPRLEGKATVVMTVNGSPITIELDGTNAPISAGNFVDLVQKGFYDGLTFHRVINSPQQQFVAQGGDPKGNGTGGYIDKKTGRERTIPLEITPKGGEEPIYGKTFKMANVNKAPELQHKAGAIAMARSQSPNSASSQFYFALADLGFLDGDYAVFGNVTEGMDVVNKIEQGNKIENAKVTKGAENLKNAD